MTALLTARLTADEAARLVPGERLVIARPGEPDHLNHLLDMTALFVAPQDWVALTGPCVTCGGLNKIRTADGGLAVCPGPDCRDGRRIVPLYTECSYAFGTMPGHVMVGRGSIEVVPVVTQFANNPRPAMRMLKSGLALINIVEGEPPDMVTVIGEPVPGRDFGILIDCVEVTT